jgi:hypothetical protein
MSFRIIDSKKGTTQKLICQRESETVSYLKAVNHDSSPSRTRTYVKHYTAMYLLYTGLDVYIYIYMFAIATTNYDSSSILT